MFFLLKIHSSDKKAINMIQININGFLTFNTAYGIRAEIEAILLMYLTPRLIGIAMNSAAGNQTNASTTQIVHR